MNTETIPEIITIKITRETLDELRERTDHNDHDGARVLALQVLVRVYDAYARTVGGPSLADPNPFRPLLAAVSELSAEHERCSYITDPMLTCRVGLWRVAGTVADHCGQPLARAYRILSECL